MNTKSVRFDKGTESTYRRQGLDRAVVSSAVTEILRREKIPVYWPDSLENFASYALAESLGLEKVAEITHAIFFFDLSDVKPTPETVDGILTDDQNRGVFEKIRGLPIGRTMHCSADETRRLYERVLERTGSRTHGGLLVSLDC